MNRVKNEKQQLLAFDKIDKHRGNCSTKTALWDFYIFSLGKLFLEK